jgi:unsaturated rhamnogalacturonyl hydrolase
MGRRLGVWVAMVGIGLGAGASLAGAQQAGAEQSSAGKTGLPVNDPVLERVLRQWPEGRVDTVKNPGEWAYEEGVLLDGVIALWRVTGDGRLFSYVKAAVDQSVGADGAIHVANGRPFPSDAHSLDNIEMGRSALMLYQVLQQPRYYKAAAFLHDQMAQQPKTASGGYWHKQIYPNQMWLDGAYMAEPFMAGYAQEFGVEGGVDAAADQLLIMSEHMREPATGLLRHGWDESKQMGWADKQTGLSPEVWARAMGWYSMALVDVLDRMPEGDPRRGALSNDISHTLTAVIRYQDPSTGLWWQVMDKGGQKGNYLEASASCMFVYAIAKAVRLGVLEPSYERNAEQGWAGIQQRFVKPDGTLSGTVKVAGLGGTPYRSGTYEYYVGEPVGDNDAKGVGAYLLAESEIVQHERAGSLFLASPHRVVLLDAWFNSQKRKTPAGNEQLWHYKWADQANSGYSAWAEMFRQYGMRTEMLEHAPRAADLKGIGIYVIAAPDNLKLNPQAHFMDQESADAIVDWVKAGGVLVIMQNDVERADQVHFDLLSDRFGIHFNPVMKQDELNNSYVNTIVPVPAGTGGIFTQDFKGLMKQICTITVSEPAQAILKAHGTDADGEVVMAVAHVGRGLVYANVDPWVYNEYTDGRKDPMDEQNFAAGQQLTRWIVQQAVDRAGGQPAGSAGHRR